MSIFSLTDEWKKSQELYKAYLVPHIPFGFLLSSMLVSRTNEV